MSWAFTALSRAWSKSWRLDENFVPKWSALWMLMTYMTHDLHHLWVPLGSWHRLRNFDVEVISAAGTWIQLKIARPLAAHGGNLLLKALPPPLLHHLHCQRVGRFLPELSLSPRKMLEVWTKKFLFSSGPLKNTLITSEEQILVFDGICISGGVCVWTIWKNVKLLLAAGGSGLLYPTWSNEAGI